jgi:undecaprenyl-diphosphatase
MGRVRDRGTEEPTLTILQAIVLGITQGVTEFAPVSSSGHLIIVPWLFDWPILADPNLNKTFDVALHLGTLVGALVYFRHDVARYARAWFRSISTRGIGSTDERLAWALVVGTIPAIIVGATLESFIQDELGQPWLIAVMLVVFGVVLYAVDRIAASRRHLEDLGVRDGLVLGVAQALALQPGVSRSGVTMTAARVLTFDRETAARFSFLLSLPVIAGAVLYKGLDLAGDGIPPGMGGPFVAGIVASAVSGFLVIAFLLRYLRVHDFALFLWFRVAVAALIFVVIATGARPATI